MPILLVMSIPATAQQDPMPRDTRTPGEREADAERRFRENQWLYADDARHATDWNAGRKRQP